MHGWRGNAINQQCIQRWTKNSICSDKKVRIDTVVLNKFVFRTSVHGFLLTCHVLKTRFELSRVQLYRNDLKGIFELSRVRLTG